MIRAAAILVAGAGWLVMATPSPAGQVKLDGSFGPGGALTGPNYTIPATVGKTVGNNLFHSFSQFDLSSGDMATFTGPANIHNVITRVTGQASTIDGTITCDIAGANFFLINPLGVMFGPDAKVNVSGSFAVTTADYVKLAGGGRFDARNPANDVLTAAPVSAFGFLGPKVAPITMQGPGATTPTPVLAQMTDGTSFLAIGGDVHIDNFQITAPSGRISLVGVGSAGEAVTDPDNVQLSVNVASFPKLGKVSLTTFTTLDVSGDPGGPGGHIDLQAGNLIAHDSFITTSSDGTQDGLGVSLAARDMLTLSGETVIDSDTSGSGAAGAVSITAKSIVLAGEPIGGNGPVNIVTDTFGPGKAGDITIHADTLVMQNGALVTASTEDVGAGGNINVTAKSILMQGEQSSAVLSTTSFGGPPGNITIQADKLTLQSDAQITAEAYGPNPAGAIQITARQVTIDDRDGSAGGFAGISVDSETSLFTSGQEAGDITINTDTLTLRNGGQISSSSANDTPGGDISLNARGIRLVDGDIMAEAGGDGGNVYLTAASFVHLFDSQISASSLDGDGGDITIDPPVVALNHSALTASAINGAGGHVDITSSFFLRFDTGIDVSSVFGVQGTVTITAPDAHVSGSLMPLMVEPLDAEDMLYPDCAVRLPGGVSSFVVSGRGGTPIGPEVLLPSVENVKRDDEK